MGITVKEKGTRKAYFEKRKKKDPGNQTPIQLDLFSSLKVTCDI
jgi:hypothetical protein